MNELIPLHSQTISDNAIETVSARELHEFLEVQTRFNDWIATRISEYDFVENQDYVRFTENPVKPQGGRPSMGYYITLDMAKELAMIERTDKGRQARRYFIECEKQLHDKQNKPLTQVELIVMVANQLAEQDRKARELDTRLQVVEAKQEALTDSSNFFSVLAFSNLHDVGLTNQQLSGLSRKAGKLSKLRGEMVGTISDPRWGKVKTYHKSILQELFENQQLI